MKRLLLFLSILYIASPSQAQVTNQDSLRIADATSALPPKKPKLGARANDHVMLQFGVASLGSVPDSMKTSGFSRFFNFYVMIDKPFKNSPKFSFAFGGGIGTDNYYFKNTSEDLKSNTVTLPYTNVANANHFKKFKLTTIFLEAPIELRFVSNAANSDKSFKAAIGAKVGLLMKSYTKGKDLQDAKGNSLYGSKYIAKEIDKSFLNGTRLALTGRMGYGNFTLSGTWQVSSFLRENAGPDIRPFNVGLTVSGL